MREEDGFLRAIQAKPDDEELRLVYADWLDEREDSRGEFLRLHLVLRSLDPDHLCRSTYEEALSKLRGQIDHDWRALIEPEHAQEVTEQHWRQTCGCFDAGYENRNWDELEFHRETQDTESPAWKRLLDLIEEAAHDGREVFAPANEMEFTQWIQIITLPPTISKLTAVKELNLYGSHLVRVPPEIAGMTSLERFIPYTSYRLHWFPYEITRCHKLRDSTISTRALYGNYKYRPPFPQLPSRTPSPAGRAEQERLAQKYNISAMMRNCSVCDKPFHDESRHRVWISLRVATDIVPLLVNACSQECIQSLAAPPDEYIAKPHRGGLSITQPPCRF